MSFTEPPPVPLEEEMGASDLGLLVPFYMYGAEFDGSVRRSAQLRKMLLERGLDYGYFPNPDKSLFISDSPDQEEAEKR